MCEILPVAVRGDETWNILGNSVQGRVYELTLEC